MTSSNSNNATDVQEVADCDVSDFLLFQSPWEAPPWSREATLFLIECYRLNRPRVGTEGLRRMHQLWEVVSNELKRVYNIYFSPSQCQNKWRVLERNFRKSVIHGKIFEFRKELEGLVPVETSNINPEPLIAGVVVAESPETNSISEKHKECSEPGTPKNSSKVLLKEHGCHSPPLKRRMKIKVSPGSPQVDDRSNQMGEERSKGREQVEGQSLEIQRNILKTLQEANGLHREAVKQMAEHNKQMAEHNAILRKYVEYRMSHSGFCD